MSFGAMSFGMSVLRAALSSPQTRATVGA